jgi:DNA-binding transcriptional LysR family regulator
MSRIDFKHLQAFILVARARSFTRAAARLDVTQSALSHTIRGLEAKVDVRLYYDGPERGRTHARPGIRLRINRHRFINR